jgi:peroxiredoxin
MRVLRLALVGLVLAALPGPAIAATVDFTLRDLDGKSVSLSQFRGKVVVVNFWATWCGPCQVEMPYLEAMWKELAPRGLAVLGISTDDAKLEAQVKPMVRTRGLTYPVLRDPQTTVVSQFNPSKTLPFNVLVDRSGNVAKVHSGYNPGDEKTLKDEVLALLAPAP